ncbi:MAG TPA: hypothetical protein DDY16_03925 [Tenacibaculum sp.]|nr:hypothetical protein [Tenacibaculum sp.]
MKLIKKNTHQKAKDFNCLNCGYPFTRNEKFCPECGQDNKGIRITLANFLKEMFRGFFSWDAKFWKTLLPLLFRPGKVSSDYISGKRNRYSNPFRFYLTTSVLFFLLLNTNETYNKLNKLSKEEINEEDILNLNPNINKDSLTKAIISDIRFQQEIQIPKETSKKIVDNLTKSDTLSKNTANSSNIFTGSKFIDKMVKYNKYNPEIKTDQAIKNIGLKVNFTNRFWYTRAKKLNKISTNKDEQNNFFKQIMSMGSISLFLLLPLFALCLNFIQIRRKYTYVEHLIFVFHIQTVFFLLLILFLCTSIVFNRTLLEISPILILLFAIYLYLAMKKFYKQKNIKTFIKYILSNILFVSLLVIGILTISIVVFSIY